MTTYSYTNDVSVTADSAAAVTLKSTDILFVGQRAAITSTGAKADGVRGARGSTVIVNGEIFGTQDGIEIASTPTIESNVTVKYDAEVAGGAAGIRMTGVGGTVLNAGTIVGARGIWADGAASIHNTGSILATGRHEAVHFSAGVNKLTNYGTITSLGEIAILGGTGADSVVNNNIIAGGISFLDGNDTYSGFGFVLGIVDGGAGNDRFTSVNEGSYFGGIGDDIIDAHGLLHGNEGNDILKSINSTDRVYGDSGNDTLSGYGLLDGGDGSDVLRGNAAVMEGGAGRDSLYSLSFGEATLAGGRGNDLLVGFGQGGNNNFSFAEAGESHYDNIQNFCASTFSSHDMIELDRSYFTALALGQLSSAAFHVGSEATSAAQRIIYDNTNGNIWYDNDGNGAAAAMRIAVIESFSPSGGSTTLTNEYFTVIP